MSLAEFIGFKEALGLTLSNISVAGTETLPLDCLTGRVLAEDIVSRVDCPSMSTSLKDGYAVLSQDISRASNQNPITLKVTGSITAGDLPELGVSSGQAIMVTTGAPVPEGASAVLMEEFCRRVDDEIICFNTADPGKNILPKGTDIRKGDTVARKGEKISPPLIGLLASAGLEGAMVYRSPCVAVIATGDEVVAPGDPLPDGKLYASNMMEICSWLSLYGFSFRVELASDRRGEIRRAISKHLPDVDALITSGGAWGSEKDLILRVLEELKWDGVYHRVRMGPGKAIGFGLLEGRPFFCLPGSPPSNEMAFLQLALPGLMVMRGDSPILFPVVRARLMETVRGEKEWTQFIQAHLERQENHLMVKPIKQKSRLQSMARKEALICIPEGCEGLTKGQEVDIQLLGL